MAMVAPSTHPGPMGTTESLPHQLVFFLKEGRASSPPPASGRQAGEGEAFSSLCRGNFEVVVFEGYVRVRVNEREQ